ncbi:Uncharacterised protein [Corynebacterium kutscheri]|uniref:Uncharacterized protein n=1 Tax=Corynebacterium kutscheri TaxID=35755 RepID=A0AB38VQ49_9CORY|nr:hypothetical protein [Corynebacterium kutscheri]VEH04893.1 Uncharacterised protein [Corynebacterium kutscheri]VEH80534.1 Uncharacterised protein [Corynebacterium kutscheri]
MTPVIYLKLSPVITKRAKIMATITPIDEEKVTKTTKVVEQTA